jgi:hypothetical protein
MKYIQSIREAYFCWSSPAEFLVSGPVGANAPVLFQSFAFFENIPPLRQSLWDIFMFTVVPDKGNARVKSIIMKQKIFISH